MKPESVRAHRRHQRWRMVQKAVRLFRRVDAATRNALDARGLDVTRRAHDPERLADNLHPCSCVGCRNQRASEGPTLRERRFDAAKGAV